MYQIQNAEAAAGRDDDEVVEYLKRCEDLEKYPDEVFEQPPPKKFRLLEKRLGTAFQRAAHGTLGRKITDKVTDTLREKGRAPYGTELYNLVARYYLSDVVADRTYKIPDLLKAKMKDPKNGDLDKCQMDWEFVLENIPGGFEEEMKE